MKATTTTSGVITNISINVFFITNSSVGKEGLEPPIIASV